MSHDKVLPCCDLGDLNIIVVATCEKCFPAIYSYNEEQSKESDRLVHYNSMGIYLVRYDEDGFVVMMPSLQESKDFEYINFYSRNTAVMPTMI